METKKFIAGLGLGMVAGGAIGMMVAAPKRGGAKKTISRALRGMGDVIDGVSSVLSR